MEEAPLSVEAITTREGIESLRKDWDTLAGENPRDGFFLSPTWYLSWIDHIPLGARPFVVVVRNLRGKLIGLAPLCHMRHDDLDRKSTRLNSSHIQKSRMPSSA